MRSLPSLRYSTYLEALRGTMKNQTQDIRSQGRNLKPGPPGADCYLLYRNL
jgi:hypothetical protein